MSSKWRVRLSGPGTLGVGLVGLAMWQCAFAQPVMQMPPPLTSIQDTLVSPEVHADHTVTFRLYAPQAQHVTLTGDWLATAAARTGSAVDMTRGANGVWSYVSAPLEPTIHLYSFTLDGVTVADPVNPVLRARTRSSASMVEVPGTPPPVWQRQPGPRGTVELLWQHSGIFDDDRQIAVYLPPGYHDGTRHYPVLYLIHGAYETPLTWVDSGAANIILDNLIAQQKAVPMIIVMPFYGAHYPQLPVDPGRDQFEAYLTRELLPYIDAHYRTLADRRHRAMAGLSAGGDVTFAIGLRHTELFSAFGCFGSLQVTDANLDSYPYFASAAAARGKWDLLWLSYGLDDPNHVPADRFDAGLTRRGVPHVYATRPGGHVWAVWRWSLAEFAPRLFRDQ